MATSPVNLKGALWTAATNGKLLVLSNNDKASVKKAALVDVKRGTSKAMVTRMEKAIGAELENYTKLVANDPKIAAKAQQYAEYFGKVMLDIAEAVEARKDALSHRTGRGS
jgi:hypothetical protein